MKRKGKTIQIFRKKKEKKYKTKQSKKRKKREKKMKKDIPTYSGARHLF